MQPSDEVFLRAAIGVAQRARAHGNHPFGALLVSRDGQVLGEAENTVVTGGDCTGHAELNLVRQVSGVFSRAVLEGCTLYASTEPCAMCAGALHWAHVGRVVYGLSADALYALVGPASDHLYLPCREVFARSERAMVVVGPMLEVEARVVHVDFWRVDGG